MPKKTQEHLSHTQAGQKVGLQIGSSGEAYINLEILNEDEGLSKTAKFLIDTGFNGYLQLTEDIVANLKLNIISKGKSKAFDGREVAVSILKTKVRLLNQEIYNFPIQVVKNGLLLIGTRLLKGLKRMLIINYSNNMITLTGDTKVQKKVHKTVEKYS